MDETRTRRSGGAGTMTETESEQWHPAAWARDAAAAIMRRCDELAAFSDMPSGIERLYLSPEMSRAYGLVAGWMREAGLDVRIDPAGNLVGRVEGGEPGLPALILGSHLDSVPDAGRYDGCLLSTSAAAAE